MIYICCVGFASLDVVCDGLNDCAWNLGMCGLSAISMMFVKILLAVCMVV